MSTPRVPLYERLPEVYRSRDAEQVPPYPLRAYLGAVEAAFSALHADIAQLYEDLFIETCDDWVIPYLADLLGTSHLQGEPRTLRADVADTIALRRRKGTLGAIERLAFDLTGWACRAVEMRVNLAWTQHLNHLRPAIGAMLPVREPKALALLGTPFDSFAYLPDTRPALGDQRRVNLPNLAIFVWRLAAYRLARVQPLFKGASDLGPQPAGQARFALRSDLHPLDLPVQLFNTSRPGVLEADAAPAGTAPLTDADAVPGPIPAARLSDAYLQIDTFDDSGATPTGFDLGEVGLQIYLPQSLAALLGSGWVWSPRGDNLCAWETGLRQPLASGEIVVDSDIGRLAIGLDTEAQRDALLAAGLYCAFTYGAAGPVGAHPVSRSAAMPSVDAELRAVGAASGLTLQQALVDLATLTHDLVIEIQDSGVHPLDLQALPGTLGDGPPALRLTRSLTIRAASGQRPIVLLARPLAFRPVAAESANSERPAVRLEGLYLAPDPTSMLPGDALIARAAVARLELIGCTLAPGGERQRDGSPAPPRRALALANGYGFTDGTERDAFAPTPRVLLQQSIGGSIAIDDRYTLVLESSIVDAVPAGAAPALAIGPVALGADEWGPPLDFAGLTCFGAVRVRRAAGSGGLITQRFEAADNQYGCIKSSWFGGSGNRLPANLGCLNAGQARLAFTSERFNDPGYAQVVRTSDERIHTQGPGDDTMGAFGFQLEAHKWANLQIRLREFMPIGVRPLVIPVT